MALNTGDTRSGGQVTDADGYEVVKTLAGAATSGGLSTFGLLAAGTSDDANVIKATPGQIYGYDIYNAAAAIRYVKLYNKATAPGTGDTPVLRIGMPASSRTAFIIPQGLPCSAGIGIRLVTGQADNDSTDVTAADLVVNVFYK